MKFTVISTLRIVDLMSFHFDNHPKDEDAVRHTFTSLTSFPTLVILSFSLNTLFTQTVICH